MTRLAYALPHARRFAGGVEQRLADGDTPRLMAGRLLYIRDDSTVRAHVLSQFGRAPSVAEIAEMRRLRCWQDAADHVGEPDDSDEADWRPGPSSELRAQLAREKARLRSSAQYREAVLSRPGVATWRDVVRVCAQAHGVEDALLIGKARQVHVVRVRNMLCALLHARGASLAQVGRWLGGRDHSTIVHAVAQWNARDRHDAALAATFAALAAREEPEPGPADSRDGEAAAW